MPAAAFLASLLSTFRFFAAAAAAYRRSHFWLTATTTTRLSRELLWSTKSVCCCWRQESLARAEGDFCARSKSRRVKNNRQTANERETQPNFAQKTINYSFLSRSPIDIHNSHKVDTHTHTQHAIESTQVLGAAAAAKGLLVHQSVRFLSVHLCGQKLWTWIEERKVRGEKREARAAFVALLFALTWCWLYGWAHH